MQADKRLSPVGLMHDFIYTIIIIAGIFPRINFRGIAAFLQHALCLISENHEHLYTQNIYPIYNYTVYTMQLDTLLANHTNINEIYMHCQLLMLN